MSETPGSRPADDAPDAGSGSGAEIDTGDVQPSREQPYDVPTGAQQYGQPPATGYQPPVSDPPGQSAPVEGPGPQQYGQPEHGQASYAQEGFPTSAPGTEGYAPSGPGYAQQPSTGAPGEGYAPFQGQPYAGQQPWASQQPYPGQPYQGQQPYPNQQPYPSQPYQGQQPYPGQAYAAQPYAQPQLSDSDQRLWATLTNVSIPLFGFVGPLVAWAALKDRSPFLKDSTTEALNFSITVSIAAIVSSILLVVLIGYLLRPAVGVLALIFAILAAIAANRGEVYRYPLTWRLVK